MMWLVEVFLLSLSFVILMPPGSECEYQKRKEINESRDILKTNSNLDFDTGNFKSRSFPVSDSKEDEHAAAVIIGLSESSKSVEVQNALSGSSEESKKCEDELSNYDTFYSNICFMRKILEHIDGIHANVTCPLSLPKGMTGTQSKGDSCIPYEQDGVIDPPNEKNQICKTFEDENTACSKPTNLICHEKTKTCVNSLDPNEKATEIVFKQVDDEGCFKHIRENHQIPNKLLASRHYLEDCDPAGRTVETQCKWYTQVPVEVNKPLGKSCLKPTHLYCDPVVSKCLCGLGYDELQFQNHNESQKCYVRPTFDFVDGYDCAPGSDRTIVTISKKKMEICMCISYPNQKPFYPPFFNTENRHWWKCGASSATPRVILLFFVLIIVISISRGYC